MKKGASTRMGTRFAGLLLACAIAAPALAWGAGGEVDRVQQIKAAYLFNFARFVTWPPPKLTPGDKAILFCILENDPLAPALDEVLQGKTIDTQRVVVRRVQRVDAMRECHVAYLGTVEPSRLASSLESLAGASVLTVYEGGDTLRTGAIRFFLEERKVRFEINVALAEREHLQMSSHLLNVARVVRE